MKPIQKEVIAILVGLALFWTLASFAVLSVCGCQHKPIRHTSVDLTNLDRAMSDAAQIDGKSVIIQQWLQSH